VRTESPSTQQIETPGRPGTPAGLRVQRLRRIEEVHALQGEWRELAEHADPRVSVFSSWDWVVSWYEHFAGREDVCLLTVRDRDDRLVGVAPCSFRRLGRLRPRLLYLLGAGHALTEYVDAVLHRDVAEAAATAIFDALDGARGEWDLLGMPLLDARGTLARVACRLGPARGYRVFVDQHGCVRRPLPATWQAFYASLPKSMKDNVNNYVNRLRRAGHREEFVVVETLPEVEAALDGFFELHRRRSQTPKQRYQHHDKFADPKHRQFLRAAVRRLAARGQVWVCFLRVDDRPVAAQLCFVDRARLYPYYSGFDPEWWAYGVMVTLTRRCIERAIARGIPELDLMAGPYQDKRRWGGEPEPLVDLTLASPRWRSRASFALFRVYKARRTLGTGRILAAAALAAPLESYALAC
jgi:CelD/BcsL family acetyltransferase involved in cellulose biosynthesis